MAQGYGRRIGFVITLPQITPGQTRNRAGYLFFARSTNANNRLLDPQGGILEDRDSPHRRRRNGRTAGRTENYLFGRQQFSNLDSTGFICTSSSYNFV